jgi:urease accessory protein
VDQGRGSVRDRRGPLTLPAAFEAWGALDPEVGKSGRLRMRLEPRAGQTVVADQYWTLPLQVMPPSYQDGDDQAYIYLLNPTGGIVQGDRLETEIALAPRARALVSTQAATKVYRVEAGYAVELNHYTLRGAAVLESLPDQTIPFAGARLFRRTQVDLDPESTVILTDLLAAGRVARDERFRFDRLFVEVELRLAGERRLLDRLEQAPSEGSLDRLGLWDGHSCYGSLYAYSPRLDPDLSTVLSDLVEGREGVWAGAGQPEPHFVVTRVLGRTTQEVAAVLLDAWDVLRRRLVGKPACPLRKF